MPAPRVKQELAALEKVQQHFRERVGILASNLYDGKLTLGMWHVAMQDEIKFAHRASLILSKGGDPKAVTAADWGRMGRTLRVQYEYLDKFTGDIRQNAVNALYGDGKFYSKKQVAWRASLYGQASEVSYWRGYIGDFVPQVPRDGNTRCGVNCQCTLRVAFDEDRRVLQVWWELHPAEHCADCLKLAGSWNPLEIGVPPAQVPAARAVAAHRRVPA